VCSLPEIGDAAGVESGVAGILFGETQSRFLLSVAAEQAAELQEIIERHRVPFGEIGTVGGDRIVIGEHVDVSVADAVAAFEAALLEE
jgi:phosphoribosylformylglycinamidine synthase